MRLYINGLSLYIFTDMYLKVGDRINLDGVRTGLFEVQYFINGIVGLIKVTDDPNSNLFTFKVFEDLPTAA